MSILFLVSTPIGNLKDISFRALDVLNSADLILAEDTRRTKIHLNFYKIKTLLLSYQEHNEKYRIPAVIQKLKSGEKIALVSDAGTPLISDPGYKLVTATLSAKIKIEAIPGPSSILCALILSGLPPDKFCFLGFLPRKEGQKAKLLENLKNQSFSFTYIAFESPFRLLKTLASLQKAFGEIEVVICRELTKMHEEVIREEVDVLIQKLAHQKIKGEITLLFHLERD